MTTVLRCPRCGVVVEDEELCVSCWDKEADKTPVKLLPNRKSPRVKQPAQKHSPEHLAYMRRYYHEHRDYFLAKKREWRALHLRQEATKRRIRYQADPTFRERILACKRAWYRRKKEAL